VVQKRGLKVEHYVKEMLFIIAKKRRWTWYLNRVNKGNPTGVIYE
jgi:hypothetical protein